MGSFTIAKHAANRANAQLSTGPVTEEGKAASSKNAVKLGFTSRFILLPNEDRDDFNKLLERLRAEHQPATDTERILVDNMAKHHWLVNRALGYQTILLGQSNEFADRRLSLMMRYQTTHERAFHRNLSQLLKLRKEREAQRVGFVSQSQQIGSVARRAEMEEIKLILLKRKLDASPKTPKPNPPSPSTESSVSVDPQTATNPDPVIQKQAPAAA